ncbi:MAG: PilZ domain-containing protein [Thermoanaerobaculia bacterium]
MGSSRRKRYKKRLQVRFWREGDDNPHSGYTTNVSMSGIFVATNTPVAPRERVKIEILDEDRGCVVHGEVVHAARVSPLLAKLRQAGMGIRLRGVDELIGELVGREREKIREDIEFRVDTPMRTGYDQPAMPGIDPEEPYVLEAPASEGSPPSRHASPEPQFRETVSPADPTLFSVRFESGEEFLSTFRRELQHGGMFITTEHPPNVNEDVTVEIKPATDAPVRLPARVVSQRGPGDARDFRNPPGINVDFKDLRRALEELNRLRELARQG